MPLESKLELDHLNLRHSFLILRLSKLGSKPVFANWIVIWSSVIRVNKYSTEQNIW